MLCSRLIQKHPGLPGSARKKRKPAALQGRRASASQGWTKFRPLCPRSFWPIRPGIGPGIYTGGDTVAHRSLCPHPPPPRAQHSAWYTLLVPSKDLPNQCPFSLSLPGMIYSLCTDTCRKHLVHVFTSRTRHTCPRHASP